MRNEKGITLVALGITIIVLSILAAVSISTGKKTIEENKVIAFINELKIVQSEVNIIVEKQKMGNTSYDSIGTKISDLDTGTLAKLTSGCFKGKTAEEMAEFKYYKVSDLKRMGIDNVEQEVVINLKTREVLSVNGIQDSGKMCYKLEDFPSESYNVAEIPTIENTLKEGDYVWYEDAFGTKQKCVVLYGPENVNYNKYGVQILTTKSVGDVTLGSTDFEKAKEDYNNAIYILNSKAEEYRNKTNQIATEARCVGSVPDNPSHESGYGENIRTNELKGFDYNVSIDYQQVHVLMEDNYDLWEGEGIPFCWAASRWVIDGVEVEGRMKSLTSNTSIPLISLNLDGHDEYNVGYINTLDFFPVFRLKLDVKVTSGDGTSDNPYTLAP